MIWKKWFEDFGGKYNEDVPTEESRYQAFKARMLEETKNKISNIPQDSPYFVKINKEGEN